MKNLPLQLIDDLVVDIINRCQVIEDRSLHLSQGEFSSENPARFAKLISCISSALIPQIVMLRNKFDKDQSNVLINIRFIDELVRELGAHLRYIDGAATIKLPWSITLPLESLCKRFLPNTTLMLRPQWKYNYAILTEDIGKVYKRAFSEVFRDNKEKLDKLFIDFPDFHIISFPSIERKSALLHCDLGHEIGHLIAKRFLESEDNTYLIDFQEKIIAKVKDETKKHPIPPILEVIEIGKKIKSAILFRRRGLEEIISDIFGIHLLGPAALFALFQIAFSDSLDISPIETPSYYPPWRTRLRFCIKTLELTGMIPIRETDYLIPNFSQHKQCIQARIDEIRNITLNQSDQNNIEKDWLVKLAYDSIYNTIPAFENFLTIKYGDKFISPESLYRQVYPLVHRLIKDIVPNALELSLQNSEPADMEAILNASWFYRLSYLNDNFPNGQLNKKFKQRYDILNRLTLKAVELSHIQKLYIKK